VQSVIYLVVMIRALGIRHHPTPSLRPTPLAHRCLRVSPMPFSRLRRLLLTAGPAFLAGCSQRFLDGLVYPIRDFSTPQLRTFKTIFHPYTGSGSALDVTPWPGRYFSDLLLHPNDQDLFVLESSDFSRGDEFLLRYNMKTGELYRYVFPAALEGYLHREMALSATGDKLAMRRFRRPVNINDKLAWRQSVENSEIVVMSTDGRDYRLVPLRPGVKGRPAFSPDGSKLAFWRATFSDAVDFGPNFYWRRFTHEPHLTNFIPNEYRFNDNTEYLFSNPGKISHLWGGSRYYLNDNFLLISSTFGSATESFVKIVQKGAQGVSLDYFNELYIPNLAVSDRVGNIYIGSNAIGAIFKRHRDGTIEQWPWPASREQISNYPWNNKIFNNPYQYYDGHYTHAEGSPQYKVWNGFAPFSDGQRLLVLYASPRGAWNSSSFAILDSQNHTWSRFSLPPLARSTPIPVSPG